MMTDLLQIAMEKARKLPDAEQDKIAALVLGAIEEETKVADRHGIGGRKPTQEETARAADRWRELRKGITLGDDLTIRELIDAGRR
jgi:hypothetical protein